MKMPSRIALQSPWEGEHEGRPWKLRADDLEVVASAVKRKATANEIAVLLNVPRLSHPKAVKAFRLLEKAEAEQKAATP